VKVFRDVASHESQMFLFPPCIGDFVPESSPVRVLSNIMDRLDLTAFYCQYQGGGAPAFDPRILLKIWIFALSEGLRSSRKVAAALSYDLRLMFLCGMSKPNFRTLCRFRTRNEKAIRALFVEVVQLCQNEGMVLLEETALDGTKILANVSRKQTYRGERLEAAIEQIDAQIAQMLAEARATDEAEDRAEQTPLLAENPADAEAAPSAAEAVQPASTEHKPSGITGAVRKNLKNLKRRKKCLKQARNQQLQTKRNSVAVTDLQSRTMKTSDGIRACYNAQAVADAYSQIIVAAEVTQDENDNAQLPPLLEQTIDNCGLKPDRLLADTGYQSDAALSALDTHSIDGYVKQAALKPAETPSFRETCTYDAGRDLYTAPDGRELPFRRLRTIRNTPYRVYYSSDRKRLEIAVRADDGRIDRMRAKLATDQGRQIYRRRQQIIEPVFGQLKEQLRFRRLLTRGLSGAKIEFLLACTTHNLLKLVQARCARHLLAQFARITVASSPGPATRRNITRRRIYWLLSIRI